MPGGYTFTGWTGAEVDETNGVYSIIVPDEDVTITAETENKTFTITFNSNNGTGIMQSVTATYNRDVTLPYNTLTRDGYTYSKWNSNADGSGQDYEDGEKFAYLLTDDLELFAQWVPITYNVSYDPNGGSGEMEGHENVAFDVDTPLRTNLFTLTGYTWNGWSYLDDNGDEVIIAASATTFRNLTTEAGKIVILRAVWSENQYTLIYDSNYTSKDSEATNVQVNDGLYYYTETITTREITTFVLTGYTFVGWTLDPTDETALIYVGDELSMLATGVSGDDVAYLYAVWTPITYIIKFDANNGDGEMEDLVATYDEPITLTANSFVRTGYTFVGWATTANGTKVYDDEDEVINLRSVQDDQITLYALWDANTYTITYLANEGTFNPELSLTDEYEYDFTIETQIVLVTGALTRTGYTLTGYEYVGDPAGNWEEFHADRIMLADLDSTTFAAGLYGDVTLRAIWSINQYMLTITYVYENGTTAQPTYTAELDFNTDYEIITPDIDGYTPDIDVVTGTIPANDVDVVVTYEANEYTLTFDANDQEGSSRAEISPAYKIVTYDQQYGEFATISRTGYTADGWFFDKECTEEVLPTDIVKILEDTTIYVKWVPNADTEFHVDYNFEQLDGTYEIDTTMTKLGTGVTDTMITEDMVKALTNGSHPVVAGFDFANIVLVNIEADGSARVVVTYNRLYYTIGITIATGVDSVAVTATQTPTQDQEETFYLEQKSELQYRVRFGTELTLVATITDPGYTFEGYTSDEVTIVSDFINMSTTFDMIAENVRVRANALPKQYTIIFNGQGGETEQGMEAYLQNGNDVVYTMNVTLAANRFVRQGYTFVGWATEEDGEKVYEDEDTYVLTTYSAEVNFYAVWTPNPYILSFDDDQGSDKTKLTIFVDDELVEYADEIVIYYDSNVKIYSTYTDDEDVTTIAIKKGYDFVGFILNGVLVGNDNLYEFTFTGNTLIALSTTARTDTKFQLVYELQDLNDDSVYNILEDETEIAEGETDRVVTIEYIESLENGIYAKTFAGFAISSLSSHTEPERQISIEYHNDDLEYVVVYVRYVRLHYKVTLTPAAAGVTALYIEDVGEGRVIPLGDEYRVYYETPFDFVVAIHEGYTLNRLIVTATMAEGSQALSSGVTEWALVERADGFYYGDIKVLGFEIDAETGFYHMSAMPAFDINIETDVTPNVYDVTYYARKSADDQTKYETQITYDTAYSIYHISNEIFTPAADWNKPGYDFVGWALSEENAAMGIVNYEFEEGDTNDKDFAQFLFIEDIELWGVWTAGDNVYKIEYYFEDETGIFAKDDTLTANREAKTDIAVYYELLDNPGNYQFDEDNINNVLVGTVLPDGSLVLKVYYKRIWYEISVFYDKGFASVSLSAEHNGIEDTTSPTARDYISARARWGETITITTEVRDGYTFDSYVETSATNTNVASGTFVLKPEPITILASTTPNEYTITFVGNEGVYVDEHEDEQTSYTQTFFFEIAEALMLNRFSRAGYDFAGWDIEIDGEVQHFDDGQIFDYSVPTDLVAEAQWEPRQDTPYMVIYNIQKLDDPENYLAYKEITLYGVTEAVVTEENVTEGFALVDIVWEGYEFSSMTQNVVIAGNGSAVVNAYYNLKTFTTTFEVPAEGSNGVVVAYTSLTDGDVEESVGNEDKQIPYSSIVKVKVDKKDGYDFIATRVNGETFTMTFNEENLDLDGYATFVMPAEDLTIAIELRRAKFAIQYHNELKGSTDVISQVVEYLEEDVAFNGIFSETGYTLLGWAEATDKEVVVYTLDYVMEQYTLTANLELYAVWEANTYTIHYDPNGGVGEVAPTTMTYDVAAPISNGASFTLVGYKIVGWSRDRQTNLVTNVATSAAITESGFYFVENIEQYYAYNVATGVAPDDEVLLYAVWEPISYTITFTFNEEEGALSYNLPTTFIYDQTYTLPAYNTLLETPGWTRNGYEFGGWYYYNDDGDREEIICLEDFAPEITNLTAQEKNVNLYIIWNNGTAAFKIRILFENLHGRYPSKNSAAAGSYVDIVGFSGETESELTSEDVYNTFIAGTEYDHYEGFEYWSGSDDVEYIDGEGTTIIALKYARKSYVLTLNFTHIREVSIAVLSDLGYQTIETYRDDQKSWRVRFGDTVTFTLAEAAGYHGAYLNIDAENSVAGATLIGAMSLPMNGYDELNALLAGDITLSADAYPNNDTPYTINIYTQLIDLTYDENPDYTMIGTGVTDSELTEDIIKDLIAGESFDFAGFSYATTTFTPNTINGDESTQVSVFYVRNRYTVAVSANNTRALKLTEIGGVYLYEEEVAIVFTLKRGYGFDKLTFRDLITDEEFDLDFTKVQATTTSGEINFTVKFNTPARNVNVEVVTTKNQDTPYIVGYMFQSSTTGETFVEEVALRENKTGETEHIITKEDIGYGEREFAGFEIAYCSLDLTEYEISGDGDTIVYIYYTRVTKNVHVQFVDEYNGLIEGSFIFLVEGKNATPTSEGNWSVAFGQKITIMLEIDEGFEFTSYVVDGVDVTAATNRTTLNVYMTEDDMEIVVTITAKEVGYTIEYYVELPDGNHSFKKALTLTSADGLKGFSHTHLTQEFIETTYAEGIENFAKYHIVKDEWFVGRNYNYYLARIGNDNYIDVEGVRIDGAGNLVIEMYYALKLIKVNVMAENMSHVTELIGEGEYAFGATININATMQEGYKFVSWTITSGEDGTSIFVRQKEYSFIMDSDQEYYVVLHSEVDEVSYTVEHYFEVLGQPYGEPTRTETKRGLTESLIDFESLVLSAETLPGYTFERYLCTSIGGIISGDGTTVVKLYYTLTEIQITIVYGEGISNVLVTAANSATNVTLIERRTDEKIAIYAAKYTARINLSVDIEKGYDFIGWRIDNGSTIAGSNELTDYPVDVINMNFRLQATAVVKQIAIRYNANNGTSQATADDIADFGDTIKLRENPFKYKGHKFIGWATEEDGGVKFLPGEEIVVDFEENVDFYAVWEVQESSNWWIYIVIGAGAGLLIFFIIFIIAKKRRKVRE